MITRPTRRQLQALSSLENHPEFVVVREWLSDCLRETQTKCIEERDEVLLRRAQGAATDLAEIEALITGARDAIDRNR